MSLATTGSQVLHLVFAALWTGSVLFVAYAVVPLGRSGDLDAAPLEAVAGKLTWVSRTSAVVLFLTGGHLAGTGYTVETLTGTTAGLLVLAMLALWAVLMGLVEVATGRLTDGTGKKKVREPAREATRPFQAASVVALALLVVGGLLAAGGI